ncbi:MAG: ribosome silencing factor [Candidatus Eremiobacteraeota bacterium]|nr:ribosome silencing factor [Candidatus Eremiobacteraeota bacterium]
MESRELAILAAVIADAKKAHDVVILDFREESILYDFFVIASALTRRETRAIARAVDERVKALHPSKRIVQGMQSGFWILLDYGGVVVHVFAEQDRDAPLKQGFLGRRSKLVANYREYYDIEGLWKDVPRFDFLSEPETAKLQEEYLTGEVLKEEPQAGE